MDSADMILALISLALAVACWKFGQLRERHKNSQRKMQEAAVLIKKYQQEIEEADRTKNISLQKLQEVQENIEDMWDLIHPDMPLESAHQTLGDPRRVKSDPINGDTWIYGQRYGSITVRDGKVVAYEKPISRPKSSSPKSILS